MSVATAPPRLSTPVLAVALCLVWSTAFIFVEVGLRSATAAQFAAMRSVAAVPALALGLLLRDAAGLRRALASRRTHVLGGVLGAVNVAGFVGLQTAGFSHSGIGVGAVLIYTQPLMVAVLARAFLSERLRPRQVLGLLAGWLGVGLVVLGEASRPGPTTGIWRAVPLFLGAAACFAVGTVVVRAVTTGPGAVPLGPPLLLAFCYGSVPLVLVGLTDGTPVSWGAGLWTGVLYTGTLSLAGGYLLQFALLERGAAGVVSSWIFAVPVLAAVYGVLLFDEPVSVGLVSGVAAVAAGILLVTVPPRTLPPPA